MKLINGHMLESLALFPVEKSSHAIVMCFRKRNLLKYEWIQLLHLIWLYKYIVWSEWQKSVQTDHDWASDGCIALWHRSHSSGWQSGKINKILVDKVPNIWSINIISMKISIQKPNIVVEPGAGMTTTMTVTVKRYSHWYALSVICIRDANSRVAALKLKHSTQQTRFCVVASNHCFISCHTLDLLSE